MIYTQGYFTETYMPSFYKSQGQMRVIRFILSLIYSSAIHAFKSFFFSSSKPLNVN